MARVAVFAALLAAVCLLAGARASAVRLTELHELQAHAVALGHGTTPQGMLDALLHLHAVQKVIDAQDAFSLYVTALGKQYDSEDFAHRQTVFLSTLATVAEHNAGGASNFTLGINRFSDWTDEEFQAVYLQGMGRKANEFVPPEVPQPEEAPDAYRSFAYEHVADVPDSIDWHAAGKVGAIKDQHINGTACGCCWSFACIGVLETAIAIGTGKPPVSLAEQQLIACDYHPEDQAGNAGCEGGYWWKGFDYIIKNGGIDAMADWPYLGKNSQCDSEKESNNKVATIDGYEFIDYWNETALIATVANQPAVVEVCVGLPFLHLWKSYRGGIFDIDGCYEEIDHGITVVGYDMAGYGGQGTWLLKNSWGEVWGEGGYLRVPMGMGKKPAEGKQMGQFNMYHRPAYPFVPKGAKPVTFRRSEQLSATA
eukprot:jgi/Tetstr1/463622/TSEL_008484.t1